MLPNLYWPHTHVSSSSVCILCDHGESETEIKVSTDISQVTPKRCLVWDGFIKPLPQFLASPNIPAACHLQCRQACPCAQTHPAGLAHKGFASPRIGSLVLHSPSSAWARTAAAQRRQQGLVHQTQPQFPLPNKLLHYCILSFSIWGVIIFLYTKCCKNKERLIDMNSDLRRAGEMWISQMHLQEQKQIYNGSENCSWVPQLRLNCRIALCVSFRTKFSVFSQDFREEFGFNSKNMPA